MMVRIFPRFLFLHVIHKERHTDRTTKAVTGIKGINCLERCAELEPIYGTGKKERLSNLV